MLQQQKMQVQQSLHDSQQPPAPPKYTIDKTNKSNWTMKCTQPIAPGELILAEKVLAELNAGLASTHDATRFFSSPKPFNAVKDINLVVANMSLEDRASFQALRNGANTPRAFHTNAFADVVPMVHEDLMYTYLRVYKDISRINHSCVPNAVVSYNEKSSTGQVRALKAIQPQEEILIEYLPSAAQAFQTRDVRVKAFQTDWKFTCLCAACANNDQDELRTRLQLNLNKVTAQLANRRENATAFHIRMVELLEEYRDGCLTLNITDSKLAQGYELLSDHHEILANLAKTHYSKPKRRRHCERCGKSKSHKPHLQAALDAAIAHEELLTKCDGNDCPGVEAARQRIRELVEQCDAA
jgi:hypothetical protein